MTTSSSIRSIFEYHDLIEAIVAAEEMRDFNTVHHSHRVSNMTDVICHCLHLSPEDTMMCHLSADLHDIGKIGIRDAILLKPGRLTDDEWKEMQSHTIIGSYILSKVHRFDHVAELVRSHHERWDGKGYPDHLSGTDIPLGSRIIAIADSMDAMLSNRGYRKALAEEHCREEIAKNAGIMYDPTLVPVVLEHWDEILAARTDPEDGGLPKVLEDAYSTT